MEVRSPLTGARGVCLPFADFCEPICRREEFGVRSSEIADRSSENSSVDSPSPLSPLLSPLSELRTPNSELRLLMLAAAVELGRDRGWRYLEFRGEVPGFGSFESGFGPPTPSVTLWEHLVELSPDPDTLLSRCDPGTRRAIRKAERSGVRVEIRDDLSALREYYRLHGLTRRKHGLPPQPWRFFQRIHEHLLARGKGFVALARSGERREKSGERSSESGDGVSDEIHGISHSPLSELRAIAGAVFLLHGDSAIYKFGGSDDRFLGLRPNNLVMWQSILRCRELGVRRLSLGRTDLRQEGLRRFKSGWGSIEERRHYYRLDLRSNRWVPERDLRFGWHNHAFRALPLFAARWAGRILYPHLD